jgi:F0F1-type ATP synthase delta subunit
VGVAFNVEAALLGGARMQLGSRLIDGTLRGQLDRLQRKILEAK